MQMKVLAHLFDKTECWQVLLYALHIE